VFVLCRGRGPTHHTKLVTMTSHSPDRQQLRREPLPLRGRVALVTGVSRRAGIGYAISRRLASLGASLFLHHYAPHDRDQPWGADPAGPHAVVDGVAEAQTGPDAAVRHASLDLADPEAPRRLTGLGTDAFGHLDILVCNHARSGTDGPLGTLDAAMLDAHWAVNTRSTILLTQAFAAQHDGRPVRRRFPQARWATPDDPARLIAWLTTDEAFWITGQIINTEGGFRRFD
jgi:3-oxoacyl-[acyl-carrier protein] reductase